MITSTLTELRSGLHFSASALRTFLTCPWKFRLQYVQGVVPEFRPAAMILGRAVHQAIALHHRALQVQAKLPIAEIQAELDSALETETRAEVPIRFKAGESLDVLRQVGRDVVELYCRQAKPKQILAVEQPFRARLIDPESGQELDPRLVGVFDLVEADEHGRVSVVEVKTAARRWSDGQVKSDLQGSLYAEAVVQAGLVGDGQEVGIRYDVLVKSKSPVLDPKQAVRGERQRQTAVRIAVHALQAIEAGAFYRNPGWQCATCQFRDHCGIWDSQRGVPVGHATQELSMKQGKTLQELAAEIARQRESRRDFVADTRNTRMTAEGSLSLRNGNGDVEYAVTSVAHNQISQRLEVPKRFYNRMLERHPDVLAGTVNALFQREPSTRMIRTLDGRVRAFLSDRYRPLDNDELAEVVFPVLADLKVEILSCEITERRLYMKFASARLEREVGVGDVIRAGGVLSNSEVGLGSLRIDDLDYRLVCLNGMVRETVARSSHVGRAAGFEGIEASEFFKDETRAADDRALMLKLRDTVRGMFSAERFEARVGQYREAAEDTIDRPIETVQVLQRRLALTDGQRDSVLTHLLQGGELSRWGLANAITRASQDTPDYDEATELEKLGGRVIDLRGEDWQRVAREAEAA